MPSYLKVLDDLKASDADIDSGELVFRDIFNTLLQDGFINQHFKLHTPFASNITRVLQFRHLNDPEKKTSIFSSYEHIIRCIAKVVENKDKAIPLRDGRHLLNFEVDFDIHGIIYLGYDLTRQEFCTKKGTGILTFSSHPQTKLCLHTLFPKVS